MCLWDVELIGNWNDNWIEVVGSDGPCGGLFQFRYRIYTDGRTLYLGSIYSDRALAANLDWEESFNKVIDRYGAHPDRLSDLSGHVYMETFMVTRDVNQEEWK